MGDGLAAYSRHLIWESGPKLRKTESASSRLETKKKKQAITQ